MMTKEKTTQFARLKLLLVAPLAMALLLVLSFSQEVMGQEKVTPDKGEKVVTQPGPDDPPPPKKIEVVEVPGDDKQDVPIFTVVEEMPSYPGGFDKMYAYLGENIKYPADAKEKGIQGKVYVTYVVEKNGTVSNVKVLRGVYKSLDAEAVRVIKAMPRWKPGKQDGKAVRVQYSLPIKFTLDNDKKAEEGKEKK